MGGTSKSSQTQTSQTSATRNPWAPTIPGLTELSSKVTGEIGNAGLNGYETGALDTMRGNAMQGNPYAPQIGMLANDLFKGGTDRTGMAQGAYDRLGANLAPTIAGDYLDPNKNPFFANTTNAIGKDVFDRLSGMYAGAGRDASGAGNFAQNAGRGIADATAPIYAQTYGMERGNQLDAMKSFYGAGGNTAGILSGLDQTALQNRGAGVDAAGAALGAQDYSPQKLLEIEAMRRGIPLQNYGQIAGILGPLGEMGGTSTGTSSGQMNGTQKMSGAQQFATIMGGIGGTNSQGGASGAMALMKMLSDRRAKDDVIQIGELFDGTPVYRFRYKGDPRVTVGLMADDVEQYAPAAVVEIGGFKMVDYGAATERAAVMGAK